MPLALIRYDAARRAIAAAHRVDEVKQIRNKAEAVRVYARQAKDLEMQNLAAEIRLRAERRAGELLMDMQANGQRQTKEHGRPKKVSSPTTLLKLGITRDQSSKWQRLAKLIDSVTFERALARAQENNGELTTAALLRQIKAMVKPGEIAVEPDINVIAVQLIRDLDSPHRKQNREAIAELRKRLNPAVRKNLILALRRERRNVGDFEARLSRDLPDFPPHGKCHQRLMREQMAKRPDPLLQQKQALAADLRNAVVREISYREARNLILAQEWLGNMGTTEFSYGLFFGAHLGGVVCYGRTAGTRVAVSVCGAEHAAKVATLCRGACVHWAHPHSASFLISEACRQMTAKGYNIFLAYSDPEAGEIGTVYQACNWLYCGLTGTTEKFRTPDGRVYDARQVHGRTRDRSGGTMKYKRSRAEEKQLLLEKGCEFYTVPGRKHRYVGIYGDRRMKRMLRTALRWDILPYPKRQTSSSTLGSLSSTTMPDFQRKGVASPRAIDSEFPHATARA